MICDVFNLVGQIWSYVALFCTELNLTIITPGMEKVNFAGGEPFLAHTADVTGTGKYLGELVRYCKQELKLPSVSIVSNGSLISEEWFQEYGGDLHTCQFVILSHPPRHSGRVMRQFQRRGQSTDWSLCAAVGPFGQVVLDSVGK